MLLLGFSRFGSKLVKTSIPNNNSGKHAAFTLAEVLITLGIIGVVAAMTLPGLIKSYNKMVIKNQFKKTYSVLTNAFALSLVEIGGSTDCDGTTTVSSAACRDFWLNHFFKNLKTVKFCENAAFKNGCVPDYSPEDFPSTGGCGGFKAEQIKEESSAVVLNDGTILFPYGWHNGQYGILGIDVNGMKGPNKGGQDVYSIMINKKNNHQVLGGQLRDNGREKLFICLPVIDGDEYFVYLDEILN